MKIFIYVSYFVCDIFSMLKMYMYTFNSLVCVLFKIMCNYRGRCGELITYWQYVGADKASMAKAYFSATKQMEESKYDTLSTTC